MAANGVGGITRAKAATIIFTFYGGSRVLTLERPTSQFSRATAATHLGPCRGVRRWKDRTTTCNSEGGMSVKKNGTATPFSLPNFCR